MPSSPMGSLGKTPKERKSRENKISIDLMVHNNRMKRLVKTTLCLMEYDVELIAREYARTTSDVL